MENDVPITTIMDLAEDDLYNPLAIDLPGTVRHFQSSILAENQLLDTKILEQYACNPENVAKSAVLDKLSQCLLAPPYTLPMIKLFRPIVIDLVARWLLPGLTSFLETDNNNAIQKIELVAKAFSVILPVVPQVKMLAVKYFQNSPSLLERLNHLPNVENMESSKSKMSEELLSLLLTAYRLLNFSTSTFIPLWNWGPLVQILDHPDITVRYMSVLCLSKVYGLSNAQTNGLLTSITGSDTALDRQDDPIFAIIDGTQIDLRMLELWEAQKLAESQISLVHNSSNSSSHQQYNLKDTDLCPFTCDICGVLMPKSSNDGKQCQQPQLILTDTTKRNLHTLSLALSIGAPTFLEGVTGSGKTSLVEELARLTGRGDRLIKIHLGDQTDPKVLLGTYVSTSTPGSFRWQPGVLTTAVQEGRWVLIEDIDLAPAEVVSVLLPLLETRHLFIPSRGEKIKAKEGFQLFGTRSFVPSKSGKALTSRGGNEIVTGANLWTRVHIEPLSAQELEKVVREKFPSIGDFAPHVMQLFEAVNNVYQDPNLSYLSSSTMGRYVSTRDLMKWCHRINNLLGNRLSGEALSIGLDMSIREDIFGEAIDCFCGMIPDQATWLMVLKKIGEPLQLLPGEVENYVTQRTPALNHSDQRLSIGRVNLSLRPAKGKAIRTDGIGKGSNKRPFAKTRHALRLLEKISVCVHLNEPTLLVGETGTGKTTVVQQLADMLHQNLIVVNLSQQSDSSDLLGGFKPVEGKILAIPLKEEFDTLFEKTFSIKKNAKFLEVVRKTFVHKKWKNFIAILQQAVKMAHQKFEGELNNDGSSKKSSTPELRKAWKTFAKRLQEFEVQQAQAENNFVFNFMEGSLVKAVRQGDWILLDEINLATTETLECLSGLLQDAEGSLLLTEKGDVEPIKRHPNFRLFACMNPATDVGKRDLPPGLRNRFTEFYVHPPDANDEDRLQIVAQYIGKIAVGDGQAIQDVADFYAEAKKLSLDHVLVDGANQKPHFSLRTLSRALTYTNQIYSTFGLRRSLYEGLCMTFLTQLNKDSETIMRKVIFKHILKNVKNPTHFLSQFVKSPGENYIQFGHFWLEQGPFEPQDDGQYIMTKSVEANLYNLARVIMSRKFPVLIQGPTSAGKTSMIEYLAKKTGHRFVRINNHEHTDLQEYLGTYVSNNDGKLVFQEGVLVEALRNGYWIVLDELNLAPSDVLEALNRLLDDNRELLIPEMQEIVKPHPHFMLFATQNPAGLYGGRKALSRAFRNRFLELHFDDIPQDELETILSKRCQIAPSYCTKIVQVYKSLMAHRKSTRIFEQKNSFITLRDLFRWAGRDPNGYQELAEHGYMLLAERCRKDEEKKVVKNVLETVMKVKLNEEEIYDCTKLEEYEIYDRILKERAEKSGQDTKLVWTKAMRRLFSLVAQCLRYREPVLLVGETGCGKTTVCQMLAEAYGRELHIVNCHQNTETGDLLGGQRPVRNRSSTDDEQKQQQLFEWHDGPLVQAMREGHLFLLDEISLADDSVLERLNSVLEPSRLLVLAEKGGKHVEELIAKEGFQFLATMNPGGDYGKKELSPALRNRFTEIWVPSVTDREDLTAIIDEQLNAHPDLKGYGARMLDFIEWFMHTLSQTRTIVSLRDILSWVRFMNVAVSKGLDAELAFAHGGCLVLLDGLGSHGASGSFLAGDALKEFRIKCLRQLANKPDAISEKDILATTNETANVTDHNFAIGPFYIERGPLGKIDIKFTLLAPTTADNAMRVIRAMQLQKPILLEGSPGVGKTSLISALAAASGHRLVRINLSEQTDLMDLFGSDLPVEGGESGEFAWRDAPFLQAMKAGDWVLLDELNLASQSVLEGLNSCLDHRGAVYIPELDREFFCAEGFRVFGAQNPLQQGGGRKGLPKSFVNRFTQVYVEHLSPEDLLFICAHLFPEFESETLKKMIDFNALMYHETMVLCRFGRKGSPWEFNLRDVFRWLELMKKDKVQDPAEHLGTIYLQRMRTQEDREKVVEIFEKVFGCKYMRPAYPSYTVSADVLQVGHSQLPRLSNRATTHDSETHLLHTFLAPLEALMKCVESSWMAIVTGPSASGKTSMVRLLSKMTGNRLHEFAMNNSVDTMELLGGFEQVDLNRHRHVAVEAFEELISRVTRSLLMHIAVMPADQHHIATERIRQLNDAWFTIKSQREMAQEEVGLDYTLLSSIVDGLRQAAQLADSDALPLIERAVTMVQNLQKLERTSVAGKFEWIDGLLINALEHGHWLLIDNANLCNPSVLDRLNPLFENDGVLMVNERGLVDGQVKVIKPHPNFRMFMTVDPANGELSRAMRNRGIEIALVNSMWNEDQEDVTKLANSMGLRGAKLPALLNNMQKQAIQTNRHAARNKSVREFIMLTTYVIERLQRGQPIKAALRDSFHQVFVNADSIPDSLAILLEGGVAELDILSSMLAPANCPILVGGSMFENDSALATVALHGAYLLYLLQQPRSTEDSHYARSLEVAGDYLLETLSLSDVGLRRRWLAFVGEHANISDSSTVKRLLQLLKAVSEHPVFEEWSHVKNGEDRQTIERSRQAMKLVIRLSKLDYSNNSVRSASKNLKHRNMSALQQAYAFSETRLNEAQLMHPIVKTLLAIFDSIRGGLRQWIQTEEYKRCSEELFVSLHKVLDASEFAWNIAGSSKLSLDNFVNILRVIQQLISNHGLSTTFATTLQSIDRAMQGFDFETSKSMKALWKYFGPATLSSELLYAIEAELSKLNELFDSHRPENVDQGLQPNDLIMKAKPDLKEMLIEGVATLYAVDRKENKEALKLARSLQHLPQHLKRQLDVLSEETHRVPTAWDTALVPLFDYSSISFEMEVLAHLYILQCANGAEALNEQLLGAIRRFRSFFISSTCRPPFDIIAYQRLLWMLDTEGTSLDMISLPGIMQDAAHAWHKRLWRSSINQQNLFQLTPSLKPKTFGITNGSQMLYQNLETVACLNIIASVDTMSAIAYEDAVKQLKSLKEFLATRTVLKDKKALEIVAVVGITRQMFDASRELISDELSRLIMDHFHHLDGFVSDLFQQDMYTIERMYSELDNIRSLLANMEHILTERGFNSYYVSAISSLNDALLHYRSKNYTSFLVSIGKSRVYLGLCFVSAYVPDYPVDPTAEPRLRVNLLLHKKGSLEEGIKTRQEIEKLVTGGDTNVYITQEQTQLADVDAELSKSSTVFSLRPQKSQLEDIFVDLSYAQKHLLSSNVESLLKDIESGDKNASQREELLQGNAQQFIERMNTKYPLYRDMLQPLLVAMDNVKYGLRIMISNIHSERADIFLREVVELFVRNPSVSRFPGMDWHQIAEQVQLTKLRAVVFERYPANRKWAFYLGLLLVILQRLYSVINAHGYLRIEDLTALNTLFEEIVQVWKGAQDYKREKEEEKERLFKVRQKQQEPISEEELDEQDMKKTFADFNEAFADLEEREDGAPTLDNAQVQEESVLRDGDVQLIGELHKAIFDNFETQSCQRSTESRDRSILRAYIAAGQLVSLSTTAFSDTVDYVCDAGHLIATNVCIQRLEAQNSFSTQSDDIYDFYKSENVAEAKLLQPVILRFKARVEHLQQEWPEHAILQQLIVICDKILGFSVLSPVAKFLTGIEILLQKSEDWEAYAAKHVSLSAQREELTSLIVRWRQLELNCWPKLLDAQEQYGSNAAYDWWFHLYDVVNNTSLENCTEEEIIERRRELLGALDHFMQTASLVEYEPRLKMLDSFYRQAKVQSQWSDQYKEVSTIMRNVYMYYVQFRDHVQLMKSQLRKPIEKDLKDFVKVATWKDVNVHALRQSAQKTHRQLHKCIRKYREVLNTSMLTVIANYNQEHAMFQYGDEKRYNDSNLGFLDQLGRADLWITETTVPPLTIEWPSDAAPVKHHLEDLPGTLAKMQRYCRQDLMVFENSEGLPLESMMAEMIQQIKQFQRETPAVMTDENKSFVKNQKLLKKKALVDFLKELRRLGLRSRPGTLAEQNANNAYIFSQHVAALDKALQNRGLQKETLSSYSTASQDMIELWNKANDYYFRSVARISHLRTLSTTQVSKDLSMLEVERSMSATEHMFSLVTKERILATRIERRIQLLQGASIQLAGLQDKPLSSQSATQLGHRLLTHKLFVDELVVMLTDASKTLDIQAEYIPSAKSIMQVMKDVCDLARKLRAKTDQCFAQRYLSASQSKPLLTAAIGEMMDSHESILQDIIESLCNVMQQVPQMTHTMQAILKHIKQHQRTVSQNGNQDAQQQQWTMIDLRDKVYSLIDAILVAVQDMKKIKVKPDLQLEENQEMADEYIKEQHAHQFTMVNALHMDVVSKRCVESLDLAHELLATHASDVCSIMQQLYPFLQQYMLLAQHSIGEFLVHHKSMAKLTYALINSFSIIISKGFCMPQGADEEAEEGEGEGTAAGTGIGEGEGTKDVSEEIEDEEQVLGTQNEEPQPKSDKKDTKEEKKGMEMENDFEGEMEDIEHDENEDEQKDQDEEEEEEQDLDDEIGDVDDMDPDAVDDKMWGDDEDHEQRKDTDKTVDQQGQSEQQESDIVAKEEEDSAQQQQQKPESKGKQPESSEEQQKQQEEEAEEKAEEGGEGEGEEEQEAENGLGQQMNVEIPEAETLELPEDLEMDDNEEGQEDGQGEEEQFQDTMDMDEDQQVMEEEKGQEAFQDPLDQIGQGEQDTDEKQDEEMADAAAQVEGEQESDEDKKQEGEEEAQKEQQNVEEETPGDGQQLGQVDIDDENQEPEQENKIQGREHAGNEDNIADNQFGVQGQTGKQSMSTAGEQQGENEQAESANTVDKRSEPQDKQGVSERGANQANDETNDDQQEEKKTEQQKSNPQRSLGDALESWRRRLADVADADEENEQQEAEESQDAAKDDEKDVQVNEDNAFEYVKNDEDAHDLQTMGNAAKDQIQDINMAAMDEATHDEENYAGEMDIDDQQKPEDIDTMPLPRDAMDVDGQQDGRGAILSRRFPEADLPEEGEVLTMDESLVAHQPLDQEDIERMRQELETTVSEWREEGRDSQQARELWQRYENLTHDLAMGLCEQLRLILEPTLATKLKGDYRTGKRLNMKKIIPYIASQFKKDKIWLRRTKPSKRQYQVMISVDDSKSMSESRSVQLAYEALSLISKALSQLEVGDLSITSFGERIRILHPFDQPFTAESGASVLQQFTFAQEQTKVKELIETSLSLFENAKSSSQQELWQLQLVISDGICNNHDQLQQLVRKAMDQQVMIIFIIVDNKKDEKDSILKMQQVSYSTVNGSMKIEWKPYLETFPFQYFMVLRDINALPEALSDALRQYFSFVSA